MKINNGIFREKITFKNTILKNGPIRLFWKIVFFVLLIFLLISSIVIINFSFAPSGLRLLAENLRDFFSPNSYSKLYDGNLFIISLNFLWNSIKLVFLSTFIGFILAMITSYFSNAKMNSKYVVIPTKISIIFLRIFPELFFIYLFKISFDKTLAINLIYCWFTWLWLHEYFSQTIENSNFNVYYYFLRTNKSKLNAFFTQIWPQIKIKFLNHFIYSFETNLRWSTILANFSYFGIGILLNPQSYPIDYTQLIIPLFVLVVFLILLDLFSEYFNKFLFESRTTTKINHKKYETIKILKKIIITLLILIGLVIIYFSIKNLVGQKFYKTEAINFFKKMFNPKWSEISFNFSQDGFFWILLQFFALIFLTFFFVYLISYIKIMLLTKCLFGKKYALIYKYFNIFIRSIPIVILFLLITNLFNNFAAAFVFAFAIHSSSSLSRNLYQTTNLINKEKIDELRKMKYSNFYIYKNYIRPIIRFDFITFATFELEKISRNFITFGSLNASLLGEKTTLTRVNDIEEIAPYLWIGFIIIAIINILSYTIRFKLAKQKWI